MKEFQSLVELKGWELLGRIAQGQLAARMQMLRQPALTEEVVRQHEWEKGVMEGIELFMKLPHVTIEELAADAKAAAQEETGDVDDEE